MSTEVATRSTVPAELQEKVLLGGDLARLTSTERLSYYNAVCTSVGLNPLTRPFEYLILNNKMVLYARKDCTDQLRGMPQHEVSIERLERELVDGVYVVTAHAKNKEGRTDESIGAVPLPSSPSDKANAMMKAETKAKRRVTLSICGLGMLDETEIETIHGAKVVQTFSEGKPLRKGAEMLADLEKREPPTELEAQLRDSIKAQEEKKGRQDKPVDGAGLGVGTGSIPIEHDPQQASDAPAPSDDPAEPYRARLRTAIDDKQARERYEATPETLKQDVYSTYLDRLKDLGKKGKK